MILFCLKTVVLNDKGSLINYAYSSKIMIMLSLKNKEYHINDDIIIVRST